MESHTYEETTALQRHGGDIRKGDHGRRIQRSHCNSLNKHSTITNWTHIQFDQQMAKRDQGEDIYSSMQPFVNKRSTYTMEMEMALPKTKKRLGNPNR